MLESTKIQRRQSEIRQALAELVAKDQPSEDETRSMEALDKEYRQNEIKFRAALIAEDNERREAGAELESKEDRDWAGLVGRFELRQAALYLDEGRELTGATAEVVQELRSQGGFRGIPIPWQALEVRAGETVAAGVPDPMQTRPIIDRLFADSVAARMGAQIITIDHGSVEYPVAVGGATVGWQTSETGSVGAPQAYTTVERPLKPDYHMGAQMRLTRKALKQSGAALEQAVRRDMGAAIQQELDRVVFLGSGASGEPEGIITYALGASPEVIKVTPVDSTADWAAFRAAVVEFMTANAAGGASAVKLMMRPEVWAALDDTLIEGTAVSEWDRLTRHIPASNIVLANNALEAPDGSPAASTALLTTSAGGVAPIFVGAWGAIDLIRDPFSDASSGGLRLTALATLDVTFSRAEQLQVLTGLQ